MDADGYPEEHELQQIIEWPNDDWSALMAFIRGLWWAPNFGWGEFLDRDGSPVFTLSTGGWSGNEDLIAAMKSNLIFWMFNWRATQAGGHYLFRLRITRTIKEPPNANP